MTAYTIPPMASIIPFPKQQGETYAYCGLSIDLGALKHNFRSLQKTLGTSVCSAVVKANAYGLGLAPCSKALYEAGCRHFFVAYLDEAFDLQMALPHSHDAHIYVLNGFMKGQEEEFLHHGFIPVLTDIEKIERLANFSKDTPLPAV
ncbi:MAG: alanine racemase, partial [Alphaproteobacteria bacterium]|nr:alanine racemase [Alphaproteobacteria bacterium]